MTLIAAATEHGIEFIYAISPGLDITFSNQKEVSALKRKLDQVLQHIVWEKYEQGIDSSFPCMSLLFCLYIYYTIYYIRLLTPLSSPQVTHFGCKSFALLFDDIDHNMCPADKEVFSSFAHAQVSITNEIYQYLGEPETFLFCPTGTSVCSVCLNLLGMLQNCLIFLFIHNGFCFLSLTTRVLWNILLPKCPSVSLPPHSRREAAAWYRRVMDRWVQHSFLSTDQQHSYS